MEVIIYHNPRCSSAPLSSPETRPASAARPRRCWRFCRV